MVPIEYTIPAGCINFRIAFYCPPVNGGIAYFDACEVRRMDGFLGDQGSIIVPAQVANAGVWTDGTARYMFYAGVDAANYIYIRRTVNNNEIQFRNTAGGVLNLQATGGLANLDFALYGMTWDISAGATGEVRYYIRGAPTGAVDVGLGTWVGDLNPGLTVLGASTTVPVDVWSGNIGPALLYNTVKTPAEMLYLSTV